MPCPHLLQLTSSHIEYSVHCSHLGKLLYHQASGLILKLRTEAHAGDYSIAAGCAILTTFTAELPLLASLAATVL